MSTAARRRGSFLRSTRRSSDRFASRAAGIGRQSLPAPPPLRAHAPEPCGLRRRKPCSSVKAMQVEDAIRTRRTHKAYTREPLDRETLDELLEITRWAPNHNLTNPWRFRVVGPEALERLK